MNGEAGSRVSELALGRWVGSLGLCSGLVTALLDVGDWSFGSEKSGFSPTTSVKLKTPFESGDTERRILC